MSQRMILLKECPRCEGDMEESSDRYGPYRQCLQCGHLIDEAQQSDSVREAKEKDKDTADAAA